MTEESEQLRSLARKGIRLAIECTGRAFEADPKEDIFAAIRALQSAEDYMARDRNDPVHEAVSDVDDIPILAEPFEDPKPSRLRLVSSTRKGE